MKLQASHHQLPPLKFHNHPILLALPLILIFILTIPLYFFPPYSTLTPSHRLGAWRPTAPPPNAVIRQYSKECDLFTGEWVPNPESPYYTNETCDAIQEHQNCLKYGRPDLGFLKWRWKPDDCDLPIFDPNEFLRLVRGKSLAFVGDSVARNHMQSLICLLSRVSRPTATGELTDGVGLYQYPDYSFNISIFFSPFLIRSEGIDPNDIHRPFKLFLDEADESWASKIGSFDYIIISAGQWFFHPTYFYLKQTLIGCLFCSDANVTHRTLQFSYRHAFRTALRAIDSARGVAFVRTLSPSHFEGGAWDSGGDCARTRPFRRSEASALVYYDAQMRRIQLEEAGIRRRVRLLDVTKMMWLRPDGHPRKYGRWPVANQTFPIDCVHWCLPGPIDALNDVLQELLKREVEIL